MQSSPSDWLVFLVVGRILVYLFQQFPLPKFIDKFALIRKLHECDLCAGVWVFGILSFFMALSLLEVFGFAYIPIISELITGGVTSFVVHIFLIGFREKFNDVVVV